MSTCRFVGSGRGVFLFPLLKDHPDYSLIVVTRKEGELTGEKATGPVGKDAVSEEKALV